MNHTDENIISVSHQIDDTIINLCEKNELAFLEVAALLIARLAHISVENQDHISLIRLMQMAERLIIDTEQRQKEKSSVH